jgi:hypothetical protein
MLVSYAVENLFKAALVRKNTEKYKRQFELKMTLPKELKSHDFLKLALVIGSSSIRLTKTSLGGWTRNAVWHGRYPVPLHYQDVSGIEAFEDGKTYTVSYFSANDLDRLKILIRDIRVELSVNSRRISSAT